MVFNDIQDGYPNDKDLSVRFTLTALVEAAPLDRVALYRVPQVAAGDHLLVEYVENAVKEGENSYVAKIGCEILVHVLKD